MLFVAAFRISEQDEPLSPGVKTSDELTEEQTPRLTILHALAKRERDGITQPSQEPIRDSTLEANPTCFLPMFEDAEEIYFPQNFDHSRKTTWMARFQQRTEDGSCSLQRNACLAMDINLSRWETRSGSSQERLPHFCYGL